MKHCSPHRWWGGVVLFVSLAMNVFLLGWLFGDGQWREPPRERGMFLERFQDKMEQLPAEHRAAVKPVIARYMPRMKQQMSAIRETREALDTVLKRDDYRRADAEAIFRRMDEQMRSMQSLVQGMMLDVADVLPADARTAFLDRPERRDRGDAPPRRRTPPDNRGELRE